MAAAVLLLVFVPSIAVGHSTAPTGLVVTNSTETSVSLDWKQDYTDAYDGYYVRVNGGKRVRYPSSEGTVGGLQAGTAYQFCVTINLTKSDHPDESSATCINATTKGAGPTPTPKLAVRGIWAEAHNLTDADLVKIKSELGYGFVYAKPSLADLDRVHAAGLKAAVWLGGYRDGNDSAPRCVWRTDDATLTTQINTVKAHPAVAYYFVDDEPHANVGTCADTPGQIRQRNALIKSLDPVHPTFITENRMSDYEELANTTDIMGLIGYPCNWNNTSACSSSNIPERVQAAEAAGVQHYWGVPQVFEELKSRCSDAYYRFPSPTEYEKLIGQWRASRQEGEFAFTFNRVYSCGIGLSENPALTPTVAALNR